MGYGLRNMLASCWAVVSARGRLLVYMNVLFFGGVFVAALVADLFFPPRLYSDLNLAVPDFLSGVDWPLLILGIFVFNLVFAAFVFVTLSGFVFFPLSVVALLFRAFLWGLLVQPLPNWLFFASLPTFILEGEAYAFAATAGLIVGLAWLKPKRLYCDEVLSKVEAFRRAFKECLWLYFVVVVLLFVGACVETVTILFLKS